ncbi:MAG: CoA transferase [Chloroflexi bacterium]|nr:CoA transferase [Chloroflexota bacterium]
MPGPLAGLRVLDLTRILAGPFCTMILADLGAEVIKVERPEGGDLSRGTGPFMNGESYYFMSVNRGKESVTLDLSRPEGTAILKDLAAQCDILVENFVPGAMAGFGLGYEDLKTINPRLIYCAISGFGQTGPYAQRPALDIVIQAMGGMMSITGEPGGGPIRPGSSLGDIIAGLFAGNAILSAVYERERSGEGQMIDLAMLDCQVAVLEAAVGRYLSTGEVPGPVGTRHPTFTPFQAFQTADGWVVVAIVGGVRDQWPLFCSAIERVDLIDDPRYQDGHQRTLHYQELIPDLEQAMRQRTTDEWLAILSALQIPCGPVNNVEQVLNDPQVLHRGVIADAPHPRLGTVPLVKMPFDLSRTPPGPLGAPPDLGQHTEALLTDLLGYSRAQYDRAIAGGAFGPRAEAGRGKG